MEENVITQEDARRAQALLRKYRDGKAALERRLAEDELWWKLRHRELVHGKNGDSGGDAASACPAAGTSGGGNPPHAEPASAWLFNAILNKHADAMDNYPEPLVLPREASDAPAAALLTEVLPAVLENADFPQVYADNWWEKLKHGTAVYGVFWNSEKENGLGDIDLRRVDLTNLFWEPGAGDLQRSRSVFVTELVDNAELLERWPFLEGKLPGCAGFDAPAASAEAADLSEKSVLVDWYYKKRGADGVTRLHYAKLAGETVLYASENDESCRETGFYAHGLYPFVFDTLFPEKGSPVGFGYVAVCKDPQTYVDRLFGSVLDYALRAANPRFFAAASTGVSEQEFLDWSKPLVHVEGTLDDTRLRQIVLAPLSGVYTDVIRMKVDEMKDTAANRDVNAGGVERGVTAASAIAALQEAGSKVSRDMIGASWRAFARVATLVVELIRQFYDVTRAFRVSGPGGEPRFAVLSNEALLDRAVGADSFGQALCRRPVFDLRVRVQKKNPFSVMEQNERAKELFRLGFFDPLRAQEALAALEMMSFEGVEAVRARVREGETLYRLAREQGETIRALTGEGRPLPAEGRRSEGEPGSDPLSHGFAGAAKPAPDLAALARRSAPQGAVSP